MMLVTSTLLPPRSSATEPHWLMEATTSILPEDAALLESDLLPAALLEPQAAIENRVAEAAAMASARLALDMMDMIGFSSLIRLFGRAMPLLLHHRPAPNTTE